jgi:hypothetical protein
LKVVNAIMKTDADADADEATRLTATLATLRAQVAASSVFVLGSAPHACTALFDPSMIVVGCNASGLNARRQGLPAPTFTVMDNELLDPQVSSQKPGRDTIVAQGLLRDLDLGHLVCVQSNRARAGDPAALGAKVSGVCLLDRAQRHRVVRNASGIEALDGSNWAMVSTGAFAIALAVYLGASRVRFSGFGLYKPLDALDPPHFYDSDLPALGPQRESRNHSLADAALVCALALRGVDIATDDHDFLPLVQNWGSKPPDWARRPRPPQILP